MEESNDDLMEAAGALLAERTPRVLKAELGPLSDGVRRLTLETGAIDSVDVYLDGRAVATTGTSDGTTEFDLQLTRATADSLLRVEGFDKGELVAARVLSL